MDIQKTIELFEEVLKRYEKSEVYSILSYSTDYSRDYKILADNIKKYRNRLNKIIANGATDSREAGEVVGEKNL